mmetsp:Transcript_88441/g.255083  ORF Transcript_88441/g.255083 Transcript_88441/m.255083 type:complete len:358 (+) Transcript_88441:308-1381(+)
MTPVTVRNCSRICSSSADSALDDSVSSSASMMPMRRAMALAVFGWSPVTMIVVQPASDMRAMASCTPSLGGSSRAKRPRSWKPSVGKFVSSKLEPENSNSLATFVCNSATQIMRLPWDINCSNEALTATSVCSVNLQRSNTRSGAPLRMMRTLPSSRGLEWTVSIHLLVLLKGTSNTNGAVVWAWLMCVSNNCWQATTMATSVGEPERCPSMVSLAELFSKPPSAKRVTWAVTAPFSNGWTLTPSPLGTTRSVTVMWPEVKVPVLSLHRTPTQPSVSTASILRTSTWRRAISLEAIMRQNVTVGIKPSGTCVKNAVAALAKMSPKVLSGPESSKPTRRERRPTMVATMAIKCTKCSI